MRTSAVRRSSPSYPFFAAPASRGGAPGAAPAAPVDELCQVPELRDRWVALDPDPRRSGAAARGRFQLRSGAVVVDVDPELDVLCARLRAAEETSLTIVYARGR